MSHKGNRFKKIKKKNEEWFPFVTSKGTVLVVKDMVDGLRACAKGNRVFVALTTSAVLDSFQFPWPSHPSGRPTVAEMETIREIMGDVMICTLLDPDSGREADQAFERQFSRNPAEAQRQMRDKIRATGWKFEIAEEFENN